MVIKMDLKNMTVQEIKRYLSDNKNFRINEEIISQLNNDTRTSVRSIANYLVKIHKREEKLKQLWLEMNRYENRYYEQGVELIAGIDEAGRGPLAGPVVAAAVILPKGCTIYGINDSKKLQQNERDKLFHEITENALAIGVGIISAEIIDEINIYQATINAMTEAYQQLTIKPDILLIDAMRIPKIDIKQEAIIKGDEKSISIAAASIIAKVTRDRLMIEYDKLYTEYRFKDNKGYGTEEHLLAIEKFGPTPIHRKTFKGVKEYLENTLF